MKKIKGKLIERSLDTGEKVSVIRLGYKADLKIVGEMDDRWIIEGYASVFGNVDSYYEIVDKGAFTGFLKEYFPRYPKLIWAHDWDKPIGVTLEAREDDFGLFVRGELLKDVAQAREAYALIKAGAMTDLSFGFRVDEDYIDPTSGARHLRKISIFEWSPVLVGANPKATLTGVKSLDGVDIDEVPAEAVIDQTPEETPEADDAAATDDETTAADTVVPEETPAAADSETTPEGDDTTTPGTPKAAAVDGEKAGRVLSAKNRKIVETALEAMRTALNTLEALLEAADEAGENSSVADESKRDSNGKLKGILRLARQADQINEKVIVRLKSME